MSLRNGDRSRTHAQGRHKAKLRAQRRQLLGLLKPEDKIVSISRKPTVATAAAPPPRSEEK